jgi:hypothetical protein
MSPANSKDLDIIIIKNSNISPDLDHAIRKGLVECFPKDREHFSNNRAWHSTPDWIVYGKTSDGVIAAHAAIVERVVTIGQSSMQVKVAGLQSFCVCPSWRKTGLSNRIMEIVLDESHKRGLEAGLLFCREVLAEKVYHRMGWEKVDAKVFMENVEGTKIPRPSKDIALSIPLAIEKFPGGDIDLNGPDW